MQLIFIVKRLASENNLGSVPRPRMVYTIYKGKRGITQTLQIGFGYEMD